MNKTIKWGIIGLGRIAHKFASDLLLTPQTHLHAVASRSEQKAQNFSAQYQTTKYYSSYEELANDPEIDVVYIATPHPFHFEYSMLCLTRGKAVLCEKPLGMDSQEVKTLINEAKQRKLFLMEGLWMRMIPATEKLLELLRQEEIGELLFITADFGFKAKRDPQGRLFNKELGGGSLLDIGIYPIYLSLLTLGLPDGIQATARFTESGVDSYCAMLFEYANGQKSLLNSTFEANTPTEAHFYGSRGSLKLHRDFHHSRKLSLNKDGELQHFDLNYRGHGYVPEIEEVNQCLRQGSTQSSKVPHQVSIDLALTIDRVKEIIGLSYQMRDL